MSSVCSLVAEQKAVYLSISCYLVTGPTGRVPPLSSRGVCLSRPSGNTSPFLTVVSHRVEPLVRPHSADASGRSSQRCPSRLFITEAVRHSRITAQSQQNCSSQRGWRTCRCRLCPFYHTHTRTSRSSPFSGRIGLFITVAVPHSAVVGDPSVLMPSGRFGYIRLIKAR